LAGDADRSTPRDPKPRGREETVDAIIDATLELCVVSGPAEVSLRRVADRAGVNYGLVHRHFGSKGAVIQAAMERANRNTLRLVEKETDFMSAVERILFDGSSSVARVLAWAILQGQTEDVVPSSSAVFAHLCELAALETDHLDRDAPEVRATVGSVLATVLGWRLYQPYLAPGLGMEDVERTQLYQSIRPVLAQMIELLHLAPARSGQAAGSD
jgi:TetR/AcrR family transcriptional regulator, repressor for neighboring sulfatase